MDRQTTRLTPASIAASSVLSVPITLVLTASIGKNSQLGTCFKAAAENKSESVEKVLHVLMDPEVEVELAQASGCAPANKSCYELDAVKNDPVVMTMKETADQAVPMPNLPEMDVM